MDLQSMGKISGKLKITTPLGGVKQASANCNVSRWPFQASCRFRSLALNLCAEN
jgi:hypothetical protein